MPLRPESWPIPPFPEKPAVMTRDQAAEALCRAAKRAPEGWDDNRVSGCEYDEIIGALRAALDVYEHSTATPSPLPAEVARVLDAADRYERRWGEMYEALPQLSKDGRDIVEAIRAYRSSQPEPLSARLARLKAQSLVVLRSVQGYRRVLGNQPEWGVLLVDPPNPAALPEIFAYADVEEIAWESP